jgi:hypothetical protein
MTPWKQALERSLSDTSSPPVLPFTTLVRAAAIARGTSVPSATLHGWIADATARGRLAPVIRGLYLNRFVSPPGRLADAVPHLRRDAVVSLHTALDEAGAYNNPPAGVTAILPLDPGATRPVVGRVQTAEGSVYFRGMPRRMLEAGELADRLDLDRSRHHPHATAEKALLDWLYLASSPHSTLSPPALHDVDLEALDRRRLGQLAVDMALTEVLQQWQSGAPVVRQRRSTRRPGAASGRTRDAERPLRNNRLRRP